MPYKERVIFKSIREGLPTAMHDYIDDKYIDFCYIPYEDWIDLIGTSEPKEERRRLTWESNNPVYNN